MHTPSHIHYVHTHTQYADTQTHTHTYTLIHLHTLSYAHTYPPHTHTLSSQSPEQKGENTEPCLICMANLGKEVRTTNTIVIIFIVHCGIKWAHSGSLGRCAWTGTGCWVWIVFGDNPFEVSCNFMQLNHVSSIYLNRICVSKFQL